MDKFLFTFICMVTLLGCASTKTPNASGIETKYVDPTLESRSSGVGLESNDVINMTYNLNVHMKLHRSPKEVAFLFQ